jgi:hypothetical protein
LAGYSVAVSPNEKLDCHLYYDKDDTINVPETTRTNVPEKLPYNFLQGSAFDQL